MFPFGIDLSDLSLKIIQLYKRGKRIRVGGFAQAPLPPEVLVQGEVRDAKKIASTLSFALKHSSNKGISGRLAIASLPEIKAFSRVVSLRKTAKQEDKQEISKALKIEIEQHIPFALKEVYLDAELIEEDKKAFKFLVSAVPKRIVEGFLEVFKKAKIIPLVLEIESIATARALIYDPEFHKQEDGLKHFLGSVLIIDLGSKTTSFIIVQKGVIQFTKSIPLASISLTEAIQAALKVDFEKAEKIKRRYGLNVTAYKGKLFSALKPHLEKLIKETKEVLSFYEFKNTKECEQKIERILLCGGSANLKGLGDFFALYLKREVERGDPWINIPLKKKEVPPLPKEEALNFTTSIGLALRGATEGGLL